MLVPEREEASIDAVASSVSLVSGQARRETHNSRQQAWSSPCRTEHLARPRAQQEMMALVYAIVPDCAYTL